MGRVPYCSVRHFGLVSLSLTFHREIGADHVITHDRPRLVPGIGHARPEGQDLGLSSRTAK